MRNALYKYTVTFEDWDGSIISTQICRWGDVLVAPANPSRASDNIYTYEFIGWGKSVAVSCTGNVTYTAQYTSNYIDYTITFKNWDNTVISTNTYHWGDVVITPDTPTKAAGDIYTYTFAGWDSDVVNCAGNATYKATFFSDYIDYKVVFKNWDETILSIGIYHWGDVITVPATPAKEADNTYNYTFKGWDKTVVNCSGDATYTATYTSTYIDYIVVFKNWNGDVLSTKAYHHGDKVTAPADPQKAADKTYTYSFKGWDKEVVDCAGDATYTATYTPDFIDYTVVFKNWNGDVLSTKTYHYGEKVEAPADPTKAADKTYTYTFAGWDKPVVDCAGDATYTATYKANYIDYVVKFLNADGTVLSKKTYHYGDKVTAPTAPTKAADNTYTYTFAGWDKPVVNCAGDAIYTATYTAQKHAVLVEVGGEQIGYPTINIALANAPANSTLRLLCDLEEDVAVSKDLVLDLNGFDVTGNLSVASGAKLFVKDSQTDDYTVWDGAGYGMLTGTIAGVQAQDGYMMITEENGVSFHRIDLQMTDMTLRSSAVGVYYKCNFAGDEVVAQHVDRYGVALSIAGVPAVDALGVCSWYDSFTPGNGGNAANGTLLHGIMKTTNAESVNSENAEMDIYGRAYILTKDGQYIFGECHSRSFREQVELVDTQWNELPAEQQLAVLDMYQTYKSIMVKWSIPHIRAAM